MQCFGNLLHGPQTVSQTRVTLRDSIKSLETDLERPSRTLLRCAPRCRLLLAATLFHPHAVPFSQRTLGNHYRRVAYALRAPATATPTLRSASHAKTRTAQGDLRTRCELRSRAPRTRCSTLLYVVATKPQSHMHVLHGSFRRETRACARLSTTIG